MNNIISANTAPNGGISLQLKDGNTGANRSVLWSETAAETVGRHIGNVVKFGVSSLPGSSFPEVGRLAGEGNFGEAAMALGTEVLGPLGKEVRGINAVSKESNVGRLFYYYTDEAGAKAIQQGRRLQKPPDNNLDMEIKVKKLSILFLSFGLSFSASHSALAGSQTGRIVHLHVRASDGLVYVVLDGALSGRPACATIAYWMIKNETSSTGKQQLAQLLAAKASGQEITIVGTNTCSRWHDGEDIDEIIF